MNPWLAGHSRTINMAKIMGKGVSFEREPGDFKRKYSRKSTSISASITDIQTGEIQSCVIRDVNPEGCKITSPHASELGDKINLLPQGFEVPLLGSIVWRKDNDVGILFTWSKSKQQNIWIPIIQKLMQNTIDPHPRYYELWYNYTTQPDSDLNKAMKDVVQDDGQIPNKVMDEIYEKHLSPTNLITKVEQVNSEFKDEFGILEKALGNASESTVSYNKSLASATEQLDGLENGDQVRNVVARLIKATQEMEKKSRGLENKLARSSKKINTLNKTLDEVRVESLTDALTGIANRKRFDDFLATSIRAANESREPLALLFGDIDHFKKFNDIFGHQIGDQVLKIVAQELNSNLKGRDLAARYGGEEFAIIMPGTDVNAAVIVANQIRESIMSKELTKRTSGDSLGSITMSFGVAIYCHGENAESFIERSDTALYSAKRNGRNQVKSEDEVYSEDAEHIA